MRISYTIAVAACLVATPVLAQSSSVGSGAISVTSVGSSSSTACSGRCGSMAVGGALGGGVSQSSASLDSGRHGTETSTSAGSLGGVAQGGYSSTSGRGGSASTTSSAGGLYGAGATATTSSHGH